jgi:putative hydrolase of the HAD superfamily
MVFSHLCRQMRQSVNTLLFDLGNVIINLNDEHHWWKEVFSGIFRQGTIVSLYQEGFFQEYESGRLSNEDFLNTLSTYLEKGYTTDDIIHRWIALLGDIPEHRFRSLMQYTGQYRVMLLSNTNHIHLNFIQQETESRYGRNLFNEIFEKQYYSHLLNAVKPEERIYRLVLEDAGLKGEEVVFLDDKPENLKAAELLGIRTVHVPKGQEFDTLLRNEGWIR